MSRTINRARQRRRRLEESLREAIIRARDADARAAQEHVPTPGNGEFWRLLKELDRRDLRLWDVAGAVACTDEEKAMIAQAVDPYLAGLTPGSVFHRRDRAK